MTPACLQPTRPRVRSELVGFTRIAGSVLRGLRRELHPVATPNVHSTLHKVTNYNSADVNSSDQRTHVLSPSLPVSGSAAPYVGVDDVFVPHPLIANWKYLTSGVIQFEM